MKEDIIKLDIVRARLQFALEVPKEWKLKEPQPKYKVVLITPEGKEVSLRIAVDYDGKKDYLPKEGLLPIQFRHVIADSCKN